MNSLEGEREGGGKKGREGGEVEIEGGRKGEKEEEKEEGRQGVTRKDKRGGWDQGDGVREGRRK